MSANEISPREWYSINRSVLELKGLSYSCVSVYFPHENVSEILDSIHESKSDENIKKIENSIEKRITLLTSKKKNFTISDEFENTYCVFGWNDGQKITIKDIITSKKIPPVHTVGKRPYLKPLHDLLKIDYEVLLIILDHKCAVLRHFRGDKLLQEFKASTFLKNKHSKGGMSQGRFSRNRQIQIDQFFKKVADRINDFDLSRIDLILVGGPGFAKKEFQTSLDAELAKKTRIIENVTFSTSPFEFTKKIISRLYQYRRNYSIALINRFENLVKDGLAETENSKILQALSLGEVDTLIISANYYDTAPSIHKQILQMIELAEKTDAKIEFIVNPILLARIEPYDGVVAILRYKLK